MTDSNMTQDFWTALDNAPEYAGHTAGLIYWATNFKYQDKGNPLPVFLELIGYHEEEFGETDVQHAHPLGHVELSYLANALSEYVKNPEGVYTWVRKVLELEANA